MARSLQQIKDEIKVQIRTYPSLDPYKFPEDGGSQVSIFNLMITVVSAAILTFEKIHDIFKEDLADLAASSISGNARWLQAQMLLFQYGDIIQIDDDFSPYYPVVDESKRIITRCAIIDADPVVIKIAKGVVPNLDPLTTPELNAASSYYYGTQFEEGIGFAGVTALFVSQEPDRMRVEVDVYYSGQLDVVLTKAAIIEAIDNFFATFQSVNFNGTVFMIKLTDAVQAVPGVSRLIYTDVLARDFATPLGSATPVDVQGSYSTVAGYLISEDTVANTLNETVTLIPETVT